MKTSIWPRERVRLFDVYLDWLESDEAAELRESGASTDFANYMANIVGKRLMTTYREAASVWERYCSSYNVPDFKPLQLVGLTEAEDLIEFHEGGEYFDSQIRERVGATLTVGTFGRLFKITRKAIINDDLGQLRDAPGRMGRAAARTLARQIIKKLESNPTVYDGVALFHSSHGNLITDPFSETGLGNAALALSQQTDDNGNPIELVPSLILIHGQNDITARRVLRSTEIHIPGSGSTPAYGQGNLNPVQGYAPYAVERYLTDLNDWYVWADPVEAPVMAVGFLNGQRTPQVMLKDPGMRLVLGGQDPYSMEFDEIAWKVRQEHGVSVVDWRGVVKASVP